MTSKIVVNNIGSDTGINTVTFDSNVQRGSSNLHSTGLALGAGSTVGAVTGVTTYYGDGSQLTNLSASNLTGALPAISGANLTGIDATSLKDSSGNVKIQGNNSGATLTGVLTATGGNPNESAFLSPTAVGVGTTTTTGRNAGVGTASGTIVFNATSGVLQVYVADAFGWQDVSSGDGYAFNATGGTKNTGSRSGYAVHTFTSPGTFTVQGDAKSGGEVLIVAGGGGAGCYGGGGGGAGGFRKITGLTFSSPVTVQVGSGGAGVPNPSGSTGTGVRGTSGTPSYFGPSYVSAGGGGGMGNNGGPTGGDASNSGAPGGSGGGGGAFGPGGGTGNQPPVSPPQGNNGAGGGDSGGPRWGGGGGGGAGGNGGAGSSGSGGGNGGSGTADSITGSSTTYAGGGGASGGDGGSGSGGSGGGGNGSPSGTGGNGSGGLGGGGGGSSSNGTGTGGNGGSGVVIVAYPSS
jgi:hypothetical protein